MSNCSACILTSKQTIKRKILFIQPLNLHRYLCSKIEQSFLNGNNSLISACYTYCKNRKKRQTFLSYFTCAFLLGIENKRTRGKQFWKTWNWIEPNKNTKGSKCKGEIEGSGEKPRDENTRIMCKVFFLFPFINFSRDRTGLARPFFCAFTCQPPTLNLILINFLLLPALVQPEILN